MPMIKVQGHSLFYRLSDDDLKGDRPPLVLIHGAGGTHMHWPAELRRLAGWTVYALDLPGHGKSEGPGRDTVEAYREVVYRFCQAAGLTCVVLAGHSMGGAIALDFALHYPTRLAGLILVGTGAKLRVAPAILDGLLVDPPTALRLITEWAHSASPSDQLMRMYLRRLMDSDPRVVRGDFVACDRFDVRSHLSQVIAPALLICGLEDRLTPPKYSEYLAAHMPNTALELVSKAGHMVMLEAPTPVTTAVLSFLHQVDA
jgi:pimeloyl-ACP methyl ester carboxylesterase